MNIRIVKKTPLLSILIILTFIIPLHPVSGQAPPLPAEDDSIYPGYFWGAAGVVDGLLGMIDLDVFTDEEISKAISIIERAIDGIWNQRYQTESGDQLPTWQKVETGDIYPGKKYGAAGIIDTLVHAYSVLGNSTYLTMANASSYELMAESSHFTLPHWPYAYIFTRGASGISITDWNFGSIGIIDSVLDVYELTNDSTLLNFATEAASWVYNSSNPMTVGTENGRIIPWYASDEVLNNMYTTYGRGNAGAIPVLHRLSSLSNNATWSIWANFITSWLINNQHDDGKWTQIPSEASAPVALDQNGGVSGTILGLLQTLNYTSSPVIQSSIDNGIAWLKNTFISNDTVQIYPTFSETKKADHSLYSGMVGVLQTLRLSGLTDQDLVSGYEWIIDDALYLYSDNTKELLALYPTTDQEDYTDLSYTNGLTGVMHELAMASVSGLIDVDQDMFSKFLRTIDHYQLESGLWHRQIDIPFIGQIWASIPLQLKIISVLLIIGVLIYFNRRRRMSD